mgnify:CR=1 FL=1
MSVAASEFGIIVADSIACRYCVVYVVLECFFFQAEDGIRDLVRSRGLGDVYKRQNEDDAGSLVSGGIGKFKGIEKPNRAVFVNKMTNDITWFRPYVQENNP